MGGDASGFKVHERVEPLEDDGISRALALWTQKLLQIEILCKLFEASRPAGVKCLNTVGKTLKYSHNQTLKGFFYFLFLLH